MFPKNTRLKWLKYKIFTKARNHELNVSPKFYVIRYIKTLTKYERSSDISKLGPHVFREDKQFSGEAIFTLYQHALSVRLRVLNLIVRLCQLSGNL